MFSNSPKTSFTPIKNNTPVPTNRVVSKKLFYHLDVFFCIDLGDHFGHKFPIFLLLYPDLRIKDNMLFD
jgi:hypothetical protein